MTRRAFLIALVALLPRPAAADERGARRMARDNARCARIGARAERDGVITAREQRRLDRAVCKNDGGEWMSAKFYTATT